MVDRRVPKDAVRKIEGRDNFPLIALMGLTDLRKYLDEAEAEAIIKAREMGAAVEDIAEALGLTRQGVYYRLRSLESDNGPNGREPAPKKHEAGAGPTAVSDSADAPSP
jgi:DNA invertase Pin-like site-specific DNA recombinase